LKEEQRLRVFENKILKKIFGAKRDAVTGEWRKLHNAELYALYSSPDIIRNIKSRRLRWEGHAARMSESRNANRVLVGRLERKRPLGRPRRIWEDNVRMDLREVGCDGRDWINLAWDRDRWPAYVRATTNLRLLQLVVGGELPCSKEEAASLAGIQLRIEESWGRPYPGGGGSSTASSTTQHPAGPISPDDPSTLRPISEDKESFLLPVPSFSTSNMARPVSPLAEETEAGSEEGDADAGGSGSGSGSGSGGGGSGSAWRRAGTFSGTTSTSSSGIRGMQGGQLKNSSSLLRKCYPSSSTQVPFLPAGRLEDCLPPCYHGAKTMAKLIKLVQLPRFLHESLSSVRPVYVIDVYKLTPSNGPKERSRRARDLTVASDNLSAIEFRPGDFFFNVEPVIRNEASHRKIVFRVGILA
ncbi:hypothetical protein ANN_18268, partial [Periplaneta americana]